MVRNLYDVNSRKLLARGNDSLGGGFEVSGQQESHPLHVDGQRD